MKTGLLGLDIGTTSTKAVVFDLLGQELARAASPPYHCRTPHPCWVEQDPEEIWQAVLMVLKSITASLDADVQVKALCLAAQSGSLLPADKQGNPVYPLITWMDGRTEDLVKGWREGGIQPQARAISGWSLYPGLCLPNIAWLRQHDPQTFADARHYFSANDFIAYRLTGEFATNPSNAGGMQLVDIHSGQWSEDLCALAGITPDQLSPLLPSGTVLGKILPEVCAATGLKPGTVLVNGGHDQGCTALGLGIIDPGRLLLACGTAWVFTGVQEFLDVDRIPATLDINFHTVPKRWAISQSLGGLGASLEWWLNLAWGGPESPLSRPERFASLNDEMNQTGPNDGLFFIPLTGGHDDPATTRPGGFVGLQLGHGRATLARAIMESAGFELRWALEALVKAGMPVEGLWMVGGAADSAHWPAILANTTGIAIHLPQYDNWPALGAGILAGYGLGLFESIPAGLIHFQKPASEISPDPQIALFYDDRFEAYKNTCRASLQQHGRLTRTT